MKISGFCDLNISIPSHGFQQSSIDKLFSLGYRTIAINTMIEEESNENPKKKKSQAREGVPAPRKGLKDTNSKLLVLQRITLHFSDSNQLQKFCKSENTRKYDILAVVPKTSAAFQLACACKDVDLISFNVDEPPLFINRKTYNLAVANSIYFEIPYAPAISDSGKRKHIIQTAHNYHTYGKSKNIIITSGATESIKIRGPYDIFNLGLLFGLSEEQSKYSMLNTSRALILRAEGRRFGKTAMTMMITDLDLESGEESDDEPVAKKSKTTDTKMVLDP